MAFLVNKRLMQPYLSLLQQEFKVHFITKATASKRLMAGAVHINWKAICPCVSVCAYVCRACICMSVSVTHTY